jgi:2-polyprenyl-3-methyl-5-hydroxy-6-metoxy-1,4-benzoquinol methylase
MTHLQNTQQWYSAQVDWFRCQYYSRTPSDENSRLLQHNGWFNATSQEHPAPSLFLKVIDHGGNILDLGCGNGLLLRRLIEESPYTLVPFGVDFLSESIKEAQTAILPTFRENFWVANIAEFDFGEREYSYILICPAYLHPDSASTFLSTCLKHIATPRGKLILYEYCDVEIIMHYQSLVNYSGQILKGQFIGDDITRILHFEL